MSTSKNVAVIGATGGIGRAFVECLSASHDVRRIYALSRKPVTYDDAKIVPIGIDIEQDGSIRDAAAATTADGLDMVLVATGILHRGDAIQPEKSMGEIDAQTMQRVLALNTIGPAVVAKYFLPRLRKGQRSVFAALSARVGSIADNRLGGWYSYRASKAALNMIIKTLAIEHARRYPESIVVGLHPGTVDTPLSRPFSSRVPDGKLFTPMRAARALLDIIDGLGPEDSGGLFAWDGSTIDF